MYSAGDVIAIFFGVLVAFFAVTGVAPSWQGIIQGRVAGKLMFDLIESSDSINQDDPKAQSIDLKGEIKFESVEFAYPSRKDIKTLKDFSCTFEIGKTTALVGPSGAGKSSIVQLI
jgi:ABC-type multidrug transport system fused ATPase/permease subunit